MNQAETIHRIKSYIKDLSEQGAFEIWWPAASDATTIYIPYMMNDAMECFIVLEHASLVGTFNRDLMADTTATIEDSDDQRYLLVIKQGNVHHDAPTHSANDSVNVCTIWFHTATISNNLYRFDQICHFWREGFEQWSQMTYIIGTMYDKYLWGGESVCNTAELSIMKLIEFAPFRAYAPAPELFEELYDNTKEATILMNSLSRQSHDYGYAFLCGLYLHIPKLWVARLLCNRLTSPRRYSLYQLIYKTAIKGASAYPERRYHEQAHSYHSIDNGVHDKTNHKNTMSITDLNEKIRAIRESADALMKQKHFIGNYPDYHRDNIYVRITEEQPFTIMDWEEITFSQRWMVSVCGGKQKEMNLGFFHGRKNSSQVLTREEFHEMYF